MDSAFEEQFEEQPKDEPGGRAPACGSFLADQAEQRRLLREDIDATIRVCPRCLKEQFGSLRDLQNSLKEEGADLEAKFLDMATVPFHQRRGSHHNPWHLEVHIEGFRVLGPRYSPDIQALLYAIDPELVTKEKRFKHDLVVPEAIKSRLEAMDLRDLFHTKRSGGRYQPFIGREVIEQQANGNAHAGSYKQISLAESRFGQSEWQQAYFQNDTQALVKFYSGWPQFNALLTFVHADHRRLKLAKEPDLKLLKFGWDVFGEYLILMGMGDVISRLDYHVGNQVPTFSVEEALSSQKLDRQSAALMLGDMAVIRFLADREMPIPIVYPEIKSAPAMMRLLEAIDYPRLHVSEDGDVYQRLEAIGRDIARAMDRAMVVVVNWRSLFNALRGSPPKKYH